MKIAKKTTRVSKLAAPIPGQLDVAFLLLLIALQFSNLTLGSMHCNHCLF